MVLLGTLYPIGSILQGADRRRDEPARHDRRDRGPARRVALVAIRVLRPGYDRHLDDVANESDVTETARGTKQQEQRRDPVTPTGIACPRADRSNG